MIKYNNKIILLFILAGIFFFVYSFLSFFAVNGNLRLNSPDETANYFFAKNFSETGKISYYDDQNLLVDNIIHARSMNSVDGYVLPTSFLGLILLYGFIAKFFGIWIIPFLTPFLAVVSILCFYFLISKIFNKQIALTSSMLLFFCPPLWYYSAKSMYHNAGFLSFAIIGASFLFLNKKSSYKFLLSGIFIGLALSFRLSEALWIVPIITGSFVLYKNKIDFKKSILFFLGILLPIILVFYYNNQIYDNPLINGYISNSPNSDNASLLVYFLKIITPFGLNVKVLLENFFNYIVSIFWFLTVPAIFGVIIFLKNKRNKIQNLFFFSYIFLTAWLIFYYGSWEIKDNISYSNVTIGNSYVRYWMPIYVFALPFMVLFLNKVKAKNIFGRIAFFSFLGVYILSSVNLVMFHGEESIISVKNNLLKYSDVNKEIVDLTNDSDIIITRYYDKVFFPERRVIYMDKDDYSVFSKIVKIIDTNNIYYYNNQINKDDVDYINNRKIKDFQIMIIHISGGLHKIIKI